MFILWVLLTCINIVTCVLFINIHWISQLLSSWIGCMDVVMAKTACTVFSKNSQSVPLSSWWCLRMNWPGRHPFDTIGVCVCVCMHTQSCLTLCDHMSCSLPSSSVHGIFQARILEWVAISFSRGSLQPRDRTCISCIAGRLFTAEPQGKGCIILYRSFYHSMSSFRIDEVRTYLTLIQA